MAELLARHIEGSTALVSGANRGLGKAFTRALLSAHEVAAQTLDAVEKGRPEVLTDDWSRHVKDSVATDQDSLYPDIQRSWDAGESPWKR
jgi:NAD(P)-dependent dehydrogenase (short-subunit alcohol dehydrogenase family)